MARNRKGYCSRPPGGRVKFLLAVITALWLLTSAATSFAVGIATDKLEYLPGNTVTITGQGWQANEAVTLTINNAAGTRPTVVLNVTAGADGTFKNSSFVAQEIDRDQILTVLAQGSSGTTTMIAIKDGVAPGSLRCSALTPFDSAHYSMARSQTVTCTIEGATDLSPGQQAGTEPVEVLVRNPLGNVPATVTSVSGTTINFQYTAPSNACGSSTVSYGPIKVCDVTCGCGACTTMPTAGNDAASNIISGTHLAAGFTYATTAGAISCSTQKVKVEKFPANGSFTAGSQATYTIVVSNPMALGGGWDNNVKLTDQLPGNGGLVWQSATPSKGSCVNPIVNNMLDCTLGDIAPQQSVSVTVTTTASTPVSACQSQPNPQALVTTSNGYTGTACGFLSCTPPATSGQLKVVVTPDGGTFTSGSQIGYTMVVSNPAASGTATNVRLTDQLPGAGGLTWGTVTTTAGSCGLASNYLNCSLGNIPAGGSVTVNVLTPATTPASACLSQPTTAYATADGGLTAEDSGSQSCTPQGNAQLRVVTTPDNGTFALGGQGSFMIVVSNPAPTGSASATNVQLSDLLPGVGGLTWATATTTQGACTVTNNTLNCGLNNIAAGDSVTVNVYTTATTPVAACTLQANPAAIATAAGGLTAQDGGSLNCTPTSGAQLRVVTTPDNGTFASGGQAHFTMVVSNPAPAGSSPATSVSLSDQLPVNGGMSWSTATTGQGSCSILNNRLSCVLGTIAAGGSVTVDVYSPATTPAAACTSQPTTAIAMADGGLTAQDNGSLNCMPATGANLTVSKTPDGGTFTPEGRGAFYILVRNPGTAPATNVTLTDQLPTNGGLTWTSFRPPSQGTCTLTNSTLNCALGTIPAGGSVQVNVYTPTTTPLSACQVQSSPATATADGGLTASDAGSLTCIPPGGTPQLRVSKTPDGGTFPYLGQASFTIVVSNAAAAGSASANNVTLTDPLPTYGGLTWTTVTTTQGTCSITNNNLSCALGTVAAGGSVTVKVFSPATTPASACTLQPNCIAIATADGGLTAQDTGSLNCTPTAGAQLRVVKTPDNGTFTSGGQATFNIVVSNPAAAGSAAATNVTLTDQLPTAGGMTWTTATTSQGTCSVVNNSLSCQLGTIAAGASVTVTVSSPATTPASACQLQNNAMAIATADGGVTAQDSGSLNCAPPSAPQLKVVKTPDAGTFPYTGQAHFTIVVSNPAPAGSSPATFVTLTDPLPGAGGLIWTTVTTTQGSCTITSNNLSCQLGTIPAGGSVTVDVYTPATTPASACTLQANCIAIATADGGLTAQDNGSLNCTPPTPPQLSVVKTPDNGTFPYLGQASFTIVVSNPGAAGSATATNVVLTDLLPTNGGMTWATVTTTRGTCSITNNNLSCQLGTLAPGAAATVIVSSPPTTPAAACTAQPNAMAIATADGGITAQDSGSLTCAPPALPQLRVVKTPDNGTFPYTGQAAFTIVVSNPATAGSAAAMNVTLTDPLPTNGGLTWTSVTTSQGSCSISNNNLSCQLGTIAPGASVTVNTYSPVTTPASACMSQPNGIAIATADGGLTAQDSGALNCSPPAAPQLRVVKTPDNGTFPSGGQAMFTIVVSNPAATGAAAATNVALNDQLPVNGGLTWTSATTTQGTCSVVSNTLNCQLGTIAAGGSVTITVSSPATTPATACTSQPNLSAVATADGGLTAYDSGSLNCTPANPPQLRVVKTPDGGTFTSGGQVRYNIVVRNVAIAGSASATHVRLTDQLPTNGGLTWETVTTTQGSCSISATSLLTCDLGDIAPGGAVTIRPSSTLTTPPSACQSQPNPAAIATADGGLTAQDSGSVSCTPPTPPQLTVVKTPDNGTFTSGGQARFTIVVGNPGTTSATNVQLNDQLPTNGGLTWTTATTTQGTCSVGTNNILICQLGTIAGGGSVTVNVFSPTTTPASACTSQPNVAAIATADGGISAQDSGSLNCTPPTPPQLTVVKTPDNGAFPYLGQAHFTVVVGNPGTTPATNVQLNDVLPVGGGLTWTSATTTQGSCSIANNILNCQLNTIPGGGSVTVNVFSPSTTPASACMLQPNPAAIATADGGVTAQDSGSLNCTIPIPPQLRVVKTPDNGTFTMGSQVTYTIVVSNPAAGSGPATNVTLTDQLPGNGGLTWTTATTTQGTCSVAANLLNCSLGNIASGGSVTVTVSSPTTTPQSACTAQPNAAAIATAEGGLTAQDSGSLTCQPPCVIPGVTISNTSWNSFNIPAGTSPLVWVHAHIGAPEVGAPNGIPTNAITTVLFSGVSLNVDGTVYPLPDGLLTFNPAAPTTPTTTFNAALNRWETVINPNDLSNEIFFTGAAIPVTPELAAGGKATFTFTATSTSPNLSFPWQWSAAVYTFWPSDWNQAMILPYHASLHAGTPLNPTVQQSLIQGPRGGGGSNFTGSWSATGNGSCP
jgi:uncharacterized repeat protein (TIGR01451 family)